MVTPFSATMLRYVEHFQRGVMPVAGGLLDQPNRYIQAFEVIRARRAQNDAREAEQHGH